MTNYKIMFNVIISFGEFLLWNKKIKKILEKYKQYNLVI